MGENAIVRDLGDKLAARIYGYELLHVAFGTADASRLLEVVGSEESAAAFAAYGEGVVAGSGGSPSGVGACWERCRAQAAASDVGEVGQAFVDLFLVPGDSFVYPWESCHTEESPVLFKPSTAAVRRFYEDHGYRLRADGGNFPPDHLSALLDFLARLSAEAYELFFEERDDQAARMLGDQRDFVDEHVLNWVDRFVDGVVEKDRSGMYAALAALLAAFVRADRCFMDEACLLLGGGQQGPCLASGGAGEPEGRAGEPAGGREG
ncbi:molecular chaperone [Adlercreutzia sp. ZJ473]|uniref:TorD/DmsD family molecular chaperone n=1 Tax=Adlercreutzia sp. ZJ473 TaxID=2722822 RepID=UPI001554DC94|nr:molecular chaperone TorD family protein [Adlercreutzia sp. ZJ473]